MAPKWSVEIIIDKIKALHAEGISLNSRGIRKSHSALYGAAVYRIGSWKKAVELAGIPYESVKIAASRRSRKWTKEQVIEEILSLLRSNVPLYSKYVMRNHPKLMGRAVRSFGSWRAAIIAAGLDYSLINRRPDMRRWSKQRIIDCIQERMVRGLPMSMWRVKKEGKGLYAAACRYFGNWKKAIEAAGFSYLGIRQDKWWTKDRVLAAIRALVESGASLALSDVRKSAPGLYSAAVRYCGGWGEAIEIAGISYENVRKVTAWSKELIIEEIRFRHAQGLRLNAKTISKEFPNLISRAIYHFGSWEAAIEAAGFSYALIIRRWIFRRRKSSLKPFHGRDSDN